MLVIGSALTSVAARHGQYPVGSEQRLQLHKYPARYTQDVLGLLLGLVLVYARIEILRPRVVRKRSQSVAYRKPAQTLKHLERLDFDQGAYALSPIPGCVWRGPMHTVTGKWTHLRLYVLPGAVLRLS